MLTVLTGELTTECCNIGINSFGLFLSECWNIIPVALEGIGNLVCGLGISQLEN